MTDRRPPELALALERRVGKRTANVLEKHLGLRTTEDLLNYFPRRYLERGELTPIAGLPHDEEVTLVARVLSSRSRHMRSRKGKITEVVVTDGLGGRLSSVALTFFNSWKAEKDLTPGTLAMFAGKVTKYRDDLTLTNPDYELLGDESEFDAEAARRPVPVYPATAKVPSWRIRAAVEVLLDSVDFSQVPDPVPADIAIRDRLYSLQDAYRQIHRPDELATALKAQDRFRYQEALILQTALARRR
ncbi:ATP-dependent DNA helicase, partial [Arthrobacter crystallopoietes BAB-32]